MKRLACEWPVQIARALVVSALLGGANVQAAPIDPELADRVETLIRQLDHDQAAKRDQAEASLLKMAPTSDAEACDQFLLLLPAPIEGMPEEVRLRVTRLRRQIQQQQARAVLAASTFSLPAGSHGLASVLEQVYEQTGNRLVDYREQFGQDASSTDLSVEVEDQEFWPALDKILDAADLGLYPFSGEEGLAVVDRQQGAAPRSGQASYAGPFRIEAINVVAQRNLRSPEQQSARVELEIAWEPRLRPIALSQPASSLDLIADDGTKLWPANREAMLDVEVQSGSHATELTIPIELPPRSVSKLATFRGQLSALVPGRVAEFRFTQLEKRRTAQQQRGGVTVVLTGIRKNQALWEVHMRLQVADADAGLESHRGWVFQNITFLEDENGEVIDHAGFETTMQTEREVGLAYFFELPSGEIGDYTWVYRTPAAIVRVPVDYQLTNIPLP